MRRTISAILAAAVAASAVAGCGLRDRASTTAPGGTASPDPAAGLVSPATTSPAPDSTGAPTRSATPSPLAAAASPTAAPSAAPPATTGASRPAATPAPVVFPDLGPLEQLLGEIDAQLDEDAAAPVQEGSTR